MKVVLNDRTDGLKPELKEYAQRKLARLERHFGKVADAEVDFSEERKRFGLATIVCRINVHVSGRRTPVLSAHERGVDAQSALDLALDKIDRQVVKLKEIRTHRHLETSRLRVPARAKTAQPRTSEPERIRMKLMPESIEQAIAELESDGQAFHVFLDEFSGGIQIAFRRADGSVAIIEPVIP
ncbi:MAG: ribosome-associated translation inhibitor RaiA [Chloroflexi bacterium]|nr:MAG: ribosome-associated translation inhibitor RaiA [Chloroflexota bacterium]